MAKQGVKFDYDLMANEHVKAKDVCQICGEELRCRWTDQNGQGVCMTCGMGYQLINGSEEMKKEKKYPYIVFNEEGIKLAKEYWNETKKFVFYGSSFSEDTGIKEWNEWIRKTHSEAIDKKEEK